MSYNSFVRRTPAVCPPLEMIFSMNASNTKAKKAEKTFEDSMLKKLSKVTDLMSRLDAFKTGGGCRVSKYLVRFGRERKLVHFWILVQWPHAQRCLQSLEGKMETAQKSFDAFNCLRVELESLADRPQGSLGI